MTRFLCLSILITILGCAPVRTTLPTVQIDITCIHKFKPVFQSDWYNTSVDVVGKHLSGLILFKHMPDGSVRVVFTNEAGVKFFDFGFRDDGTFTIYHIIKQLNKKPVVTALQKDFELLLLSEMGYKKPVSYQERNELKFAFAGKKETNYVVTNQDCSRLIRLEKGYGLEKKTAAFLYGQGQHAPDSMLVQHFNFNMTIKLRRLKKES